MIVFRLSNAKRVEKLYPQRAIKLRFFTLPAPVTKGHLARRYLCSRKMRMTNTSLSDLLELCRVELIAQKTEVHLAIQKTGFLQRKVFTQLELGSAGLIKI